MKCPKCAFENPEGIKFCGECGSKLERICPDCQAMNPLKFKFCGECGAALVIQRESVKELSFDEKIDKIQRYLPKGLTDKILSQRGKIEGERKQVSVMFCDLKGFTPLVEKLGSEDAYHMMDQIYEILIHKVHDYEGTVNDMTGDGVMALFGAPIALEDAPQRAIRSAMSIHKAVAKFSNEQIHKNADFPTLRMRIGIHTGPVVVGTLGNNLRVEFKAVGNTVNLASRIENLAEAGTIFVSEDTYKLTEGFFRYEALGGKKVKGKKASVGIYRVIAPSSKRSRFDVSAEQGLTHFVGRQRELEVLIDGFERSKSGYGNSFSIVSEAGAGKSRLLYEFRKAVTNEDITFLEGKCLSFSKNTAYFPIVELLKATFGVGENNTDIETIGKVKKGLQYLAVNEDLVLVYVLELLSVKDSGFDYTSMSPESKKDRTMEALKLITLKLSEIRPIVLAFEDLHWIDNDSEECIRNILDSVSGARIFLIFTYRTDFSPTWGSRSYHSQINLNRLSNRESLMIASQFLETDRIHGNLEEWILSKTEGVPLFIEEFINYLMDIKAIEVQKDGCYLKGNIKEISIPSSIHDVIAARVDTLRETSKLVLQVGAAIEREFSYQLLKQVTGFEDDKLLKVLIALKNAELIFERGAAPDTIYIFRHALTRDVIYDSIIAKRRKQLHEDIGNAIEVVYPDRLGEYFGILSEHYFISENYQKAAEYSKLAAKKSSRAVSFKNAIAFTEKWVTSLEFLPTTETVEKQLIDARTTLGFYHLQMQNYEAAKSAITPIIELAERHQYEKGLSQIFSLRGIHEYLIKEDYTKAVDYLKKAIHIAEKTNNFISLIFSNHFLGHVYSENCEFEKGLEYIKKSLDIVEMGNVLWSIAMHKACIAFTIFNMQGKIDLAYQSGKEAIQLAEESGDIFSKAEAYTNSGACCFYKGSFKEAEEYLLLGRQFSKKAHLPGHEYIADFHLGEVYYFLENYNKAHKYFLNAISFEGKGTLGKSYTNLCKMILAAAKIKDKVKDIDLDIFRSWIYQNKIKRTEGRYRRYFSKILLDYYEEPNQEAKDMIKQAIAIDQENELPYELGMDYVAYADFFKLTGNSIKTKEKLDSAVKIFKKCGADGWVNRFEKELAEL